MSTIIFNLGILAGFFQILGYFFYIKDENIDPNPVTWFMFAYGTGILTLLEWDMGATLAELFLPIACSVLSIYVSWRCWKKARSIDPNKWWPEDWWPEDFWEKGSFVSDIIITIGYITAWALAAWSLLTPEYREIAVISFLILSNLSTFPSFYPLLKQTSLEPHKEHWLPWATWTLAYGILAVVTYLIQNEFWHILMFYPLSNVFLHGLTAWLARPGAKRRYNPTAN